MAHFKIIIVGGGTAGLATAVTLRDSGHDVTVLERHASTQALGGPVSLSPSATRIFEAHGMRDRFEKISTGKGGHMIRNWRYDGTLLSEVTDEQRIKLYGYPTYILARARLQENLAEVGKERGVKILFNSQVESVDPEKPAVRLKDGTTLEADLIVGADGYRSPTRAAVLDGQKIEPVSPITTYNIDVPRTLLAKDPELEPFIHSSNLFLGPRQSVVAMNMPDYGDKYNVALVTEDEEGEEGNWHQHGNLEAVKKRFAHFDHRVGKVLDLTDPKNCYEWRLSDLPPLDRWVSKSGKVVIIGDAAHGMLPFAGVGATMAAEDAACLAICIGRAKTVSDLPKLLGAFEKIRKPRCEHFVRRGRKVKEFWHVEDGPVQEKRDKFYTERPYGTVSKEEWDGSHIDDPPQGDFNPLSLPYAMAHNVIDYTNRRLDQLLPSENGHL